MTDAKLLQEKIENSGISITFIAQKLGISRQTLYSRINGKSEFNASNIAILTDLLRLTDNERDAIFFAENVECVSTTD